MKKTLAFFLAFGLCSVVWAQIPPTPISHLDVNNIRATITGDGSMLPPHFAENDAITCPWYEVPQGSGCMTVFQQALWFGGKDAADELHLAGNVFNNNGYDYQMGPLKLADASSDFMTQLKYMRIWNLTRGEIDNFIAHHGDSGYEIPKDILEWPAHGEEGFAPNLAPFVDVNGDGRYVPTDGDYPDIMGDQCLFFIFNDACCHWESFGEPVGLEVHAMVYAFDAPDDEALNNTIFFNYKCFNRSQNHYSDAYVGLFADLDIGYAKDDYMGCDVQRGSFYAYNGTLVDGEGQSGTYGDNPPVQVVSVLAGPRMDADGRDNPAFDGIGEHLFNEEYPNDMYAYNGTNFGNGIPDDERFGLSNFMLGTPFAGSPESMYLLMRMITDDGLPVMYGYACEAVGPACRYIYPGDSDPVNFGTYGFAPNEGFNTNGKYWSEEYCEKDPDDRKGVGSMGPFTFSAGDMQEIDFALITVWKNEIQSAMERRGEFIDHIKEFFFNGLKK